MSNLVDVYQSRASIRRQNTIKSFMEEFEKNIQAITLPFIRMTEQASLQQTATLAGIQQLANESEQELRRRILSAMRGDFHTLSTLSENISSV